MRRRWVAAAWVALGALIVANFVLLRDLLERTEQWNPYEPFPLVAVSPPPDRTDTVTITETRCYRTLPVTETETISFTRTPGVSTLATTRIATTTEQGADSHRCLRRTRRIPIPPAVRQEVDQVGPSRWVLEGTLTPLRTGTVGKPGTWTSEPFELTP